MYNTYLNITQLSFQFNNSEAHVVADIVHVRRYTKLFHNTFVIIAFNTNVVL